MKIDASNCVKKKISLNKTARATQSVICIHKYGK